MKRVSNSQSNRPQRDGNVSVYSSVGPASEVKDGWGNYCRSRLRRGTGLVAQWLLARRTWILGLGHSALFVLVFWLAFVLRFDFAVPTHMVDVFWMGLPLLVVVKAIVFYLSGHYHGWWRYVTFADLAALLRASVLSLLVLAAVDHFVLPYQVPRVILVLDCVVGIMVLGALRASWRLFREQFWPAFGKNGCRQALLVGADHSSGLLAHQIHSHSQLQFRITGFLDISSTPKGSRLGQIPILGKLEDVAEIARTHKATDVLVTTGTLSGKRLRRLMETCGEAGLNLMIIPPVSDMFNGDSRIPVQKIEISDLLQREAVKLDTQAIGELLDGRTVMVTGAGGSIGSEICRQVLKFNPRTLVLVGKGENRVFMIDQELRSFATPTKVYACIADVTDRERMRQLFEEHAPEVVFHAAAHKHVPLMEVNVGEAIKNNVSGTKCLADLADQFGVLSFVFISTDKAVHPSSVMGVSKHIAERYVHTLSQESSTRFVVTRFGNVLGSNGSVVPIFQEQIRRGGPITVTDARMTRFFMTIPEASQLVLQAAAMGRGGEIFVLEMGEPVRIVDLAYDLIRLSGLPKDAIDVTFTGVRPGEKLFEELYFDEEETLSTSHPKLRAAFHRPYSMLEVCQVISELEQLVYGPEEIIRRKLHEIVPEYRPFSVNGAEAA